MRTLGRGIPCTAAAILLMSLVTPVEASPTFVGGGGYELYAGADGQRTRSAMATVGAEDGAHSASLTFIRYSDAHTGDGSGYVLAGAIPVTTAATLRAWGSRFVGDETLRAWRVKAGPVFELTGVGAAGLYYSHARDDMGLRSDGASLELAVPISTRFTGRGAAAYAVASDGVRAVQGTVGLGVAPVHALELVAEAGFAHNASLITSSAPSRGPLDPLFGGNQGDAGAEASRMDPVLLFSVRLLLP